MAIATQPRWKKGESLCAYCGINVGTTSDHVIPKTLFIVKDKQMITVPACQPCQLAKRLGERDLRNFCTLHIGSYRHEHLLEHARRMVESNPETRAWLERTLASAKEVILVDENDVEIGRILEFDFNTDRMMEALKFVFRGLYYMKRGQPLRAACPVEVTVIPWSIFPKLMQKLGRYRLDEPIIKGNFAVWFSELNTNPVAPENTAWVLCVNDGVGFIGTTGLSAVLAHQLKEDLATKTESRPKTEPHRFRAPRSPEGLLLL